MVQISVTDKRSKENNLYYIQNSLKELCGKTGINFKVKDEGARSVLEVATPEEYGEIVSAEVAEKIAEIIAINYKYTFFKEKLKISGLTETEREILLTGLIAADLDDDKRYAYNRLKDLRYFAVDGVFNFRLQALKRKWQDIVSYMPDSFLSSQLKEFITFFLKNKRNRSYVDKENVYDGHFRKLNRCFLLGGEKLRILREILLSNCGEVGLLGPVPEDDGKYLEDYFGNKIFTNESIFN